MAVLTKLDHASICVGEIDKAVWFYRDLLGLKPTPRPDFGFPGAWFDAGGTPLHLTTGGDLWGEGGRLLPQNSHVAFQVDDLDEMIDQLKDNDVDYWELPDSPAALRQVFFRDPWGNMIELILHHA